MVIIINDSKQKNSLNHTKVNISPMTLMQCHNEKYFRIGV
jgi:hypothetical protein